MVNDVLQLKKIRWLYVLAGVVVLLCVGLIYAWSVFRVPLESEFGWTKAEASVTFTISMIMYCLGSLVSGVITGKYGPRRTLILCAGFLGTGFVAAAHIQSLWGIYITYGILCGFGVGLGYNCCISTCVKWFPDKQGLASGLTMFGFGGGAMIFGTLAANLIAVLGWRMTFVIIGGTFAIIIFLAALFIKPVSTGFMIAISSATRQSSQAIEEIDWREMLHRRNWWYYFGFTSMYCFCRTYAVQYFYRLCQSVCVR